MIKRKLSVLCGIFALSGMLLLAGCGGSAGSSGDGKEDSPAVTEQEVSETTTAAAEETQTTAAQAAETQSAVDCSFTLEGKEYTLPFDYSVLEADGWSTDVDVSQELGGMTYTFIFMNKDNKGSMTFYIYNGSGNNKAVKDCQVAGVKCSKDNLDDYSFALSNGLKPGDDRETVEAAMGTPTNSNDYDSSVQIDYGENRDTGQISFVWFTESGNAEIEISNYQREETTTSSEVPSYLSEYTAPTAIGDNFDSSTFSLEKTVYKLPCPVSEFVKDGWTLKEDEDVMAGRLEISHLIKGEMDLQVTLNNFAEYQTPASNCVVTELTVNAYSDTNPVPEFNLPKGLSMNSTKEEIEKAIDESGLEFSKDESDDAITYNYNDYDKGTGATFYYSTEKKRIMQASAEGKNWPGK